MQSEKSFITYPTWKKYIVLSRFVDTLRVKDKRQIFHMMRNHGPDELHHDTFFPHFGITAGEFSVWQVLSENSRKTRRKQVY
jgi:hypothetical protein